MFLRIFKHLLPRARAWQITIEKQLREFFQGLAGLGSDVKLFADQVFEDIFPQTTRELDAWEKQWGLPSVILTDQQRRDRLDGAWKAQGGQSPRYIQDTLRNAGFDVFVHDWWELPVGLVDSYFDECGAPNAECGQPEAECGNIIGTALTGIPSARNPFDFLSDGGAVGYTLSCGAATAVCGGVSAICGASTTGTGNLLVNLPGAQPNIPPEADWPYIIYIGGQVYGVKAQVPLTRRDEFEALCLKICPTQLWIGLIVEFN
jgi:hypothetical protein